MSKPRRSNKRNHNNNNNINRQIAIARSPTMRTKVVLTVNGVLGSDGAGVLAGAFSMNPSSADKWSQYASIYDCFRVVGGRLSLASVASNSGTSLNSLCIFAFDNDSSGTPTAYSDVTSYSEVKRLPVCWSSGAIKTVPFSRPVIGGIIQSTSSLWIDEQSPSNSLGSLKFYASALTASTNYWHYVLEYLCEFLYRS